VGESENVAQFRFGKPPFFHDFGTGKRDHQDVNAIVHVENEANGYNEDLKPTHGIMVNQGFETGLQRFVSHQRNI